MKISKEFKAGILFILTLIAFYIMFMFLKGKDIFARDNIYYAVYDDLMGLSTSNPVSFRGSKVGTVDKIQANYDNPQNPYFLVTFKIDDKLNIPKNSSADIISDGLFGGKFVNLDFSKNKDILHSGDTLKGIATASLSDNLASSMGDLQTKLGNVLVKLDTTLTNVNTVLGPTNQKHVESAMKNLESTMTNLSNSTSKLDKIVQQNGSEITRAIDQTNALLATTTSTIKEYQTLGKKLNEVDFNKITKNLSDALGNLKDITKKVNDGDGSMGQLVNNKDLYNNLNSTLSQLNSLLADMQTNPGKYVQISVFGKKSKPAQPAVSK